MINTTNKIERRQRPQIVLAALMMACLQYQGQAQQSAGPAAFVNPLIGTANDGNTFPGAVLPFGMVAFSPEELPAQGRRGSLPGGYVYDATAVRGFSLTHLSGAGCPGSGDFLFMPVAGEVKESPALDPRDSTYLSSLQHSNEHTAAGYYAARLQNGVLVELSATLRTGMARFTFPTGKPATLLIRSSDNETLTTASQVRIDPAKRTVSGWLQSGGFCRGGPVSDYDAYYKIFFFAEFDQSFATFGTWQDTQVRSGALTAQGGNAVGGEPVPREGSAGRGSGAYLSFANTAGSKVQMRVGVSYVSEANAEENLHAESPSSFSFSVVRARAFDAWNDVLDLIEVKGETHEQKTVFYTALYHALLHMNLVSDVNGQYRGMDENVHEVMKPQAAQYANFSGWDVYRSQVQLIALLYPQVASDMAQSLLNQAHQWGCWSRWTHETGAANVMNGDPSASAIAAIAAFGGDRFDVKGAYASLLDAAYTPHEGHRCSRPHLEEWLKQHYLTASNAKHDTSVSDTLEFSTADFALSQLAEQMGETDKEKELLARAQNWKNLFNPGATWRDGYLQAKNADGTWKSFDPTSTDGFVEGTGAQYLWMVPFDAEGLFASIGGRIEAIRRLDSFFHDSTGSWAFTSGGLHPGLNNEPCLSAPWLYDFAGAPYKTQEAIGAILEKLWRDTPDGIPGNDDLGEMSSWYVWAALGIYPEIPGRAELVLTTPLFSEAVIHRSSRTIRIVALRKTRTSRFIENLRLNGNEWKRPWLPQSFVRLGGTLVFKVAGEPSQNWGTLPEDAPPSFDVH